MSLQFIIGSSGSGKTYHLYKNLIEMSVAQEDCNYLVLVPEQATLQTQKEIVNMHPAHGVMNIDILSFERLAYRVFEELGCAPKVVLDDVGKNMLLRKAFSKVSGELSVYRKNLKKAGFIDEVKSLFSELYQYRIGIEDLEGMIDATKGRPLVNRKLQDILILNRAFNECIEEGTIAAEEVLEVLGKVISQSETVRNSVITLDGFTGFTPIQYEVIRKLLKLAKKVIVTVTVDDRENPYKEEGSHTLFYLSRKTIERLSGIAKEEKVARDEDIRLTGVPYRFKDRESLAVLERELFRYPFKVAEGCEGISVHALANPKAEAEFLAEEIFRLVRDEGVRYREIGVIAADISTYRPFISRYFDEAGIPCFLDDKKSLMSNPLVEYIRAVLEVIERRFDYNSVFRYLKCGFLEEHSEAIYEMENYVLATGIKGRKAWSESWEPLYVGGEHLNMEWLNREKEEIIAPVLVLDEKLQGELTVDTAIRALYEWLYSQFADEKLEKMAEEFEAAGEYALAKEYRQAYSMVLDLLDKLIGLVPEAVLNLKELSEILDAGFEKIKVGMIPPCIDRVMVGDMTRSRLKDIKHLFILGMNDCYLPKSKDNGGILSDTDRDILADFGIELAPGARENSFIERLYVYLAVTKPSESLTLTFAKSSMDGKGLRPSSYVSSVLKLFKGLEIIDEDENKDIFRKIISKESAVSLLTEGLREYQENHESRAWKELYSWFAREDKADELKFLVDNAFVQYEPESIGRSLAKLLYGDNISGSVTRLEQYAACAYAQFLSYGLELNERRQYEFAAVDMGNMFHSSIETFFKHIRKEKISLKDITDEQRLSIVSQCVEKAYELNGSSVLRSSARNKYMLKRIERIVDKTVWAIGEQLGRGSFEATGFEVSFGSGSDAMLITLNEEESMKLRGKVDRIDTCTDGDEVLIKITDYKSGTTEFDAASVYDGLQIQLIVYLDAVMRREKLLRSDKNVRVAGMFYYNISDPIIDSDKLRIGLEEARDEALEKLKPNGLVNSDLGIIRLLDNDIEDVSSVIPVVLKDGMVNEKKSEVASDVQFDRLIGHVRGKMTEFAEDMISGNIAVLPYKKGNDSGCDFCRFKTVCGFDTKIPGFKFRKLPAMSNEELWEKI